MDNKILAFARVSTSRQDLEQHKQVLTQKAQQLGYRLDQIIFIGEKESGRKLEEEERLTIQEMWNHINNDPTINCVLAFEISRIARKPKICFSVRDQLLQRHIQLVIMNPECICFNTTDWTINQSANIVFAIFASLAENESNLFLERSRRGKKRQAELGKYSGGKVKFGYMVDEDKNLVPNPETAPIVRLIFQLRIEHKMSPWEITEELKSRGHSVPYTTIRKIVKDETYTGKKMKAEHCTYERQRVPIITEEEFRLAQDNSISSSNSNRRKRGTVVRLTQKLLFCPECGGVVGTSYGGTNSKRKAYLGCLCNRRNIYYEIKHCSNSCSVQESVVDDLIWTVAKYYYKMEVILLKGKSLKSLKEEKEVQEQKLVAAQSRLDKIDLRRSRLNKIYLEGDLSEDDFQRNREQINADKRDVETMIADIEIKINRVGEQIDVLLNSNVSEEEADKMISDIETSGDIEKKREIVLKIVKRITLEYLDGETRHKLLKVYLHGSTNTCEEFVITARKYQIYRFAITVEGDRFESGMIPFDGYH